MAFVTLLLVALAVGVPAVDGATPKRGTFENKSQSKGLYLETTRHTVRTLWLFCRDHRYDGATVRPERRQGRYEIRHPVRIRSGGRFSYEGTGYRYGPESQPLGKWRMKVSGRFTSRTRVKITRSLHGCGPRLTTSAHRTGGL